MSTSDERIRVARELNKSAQNMYKIWCNDLCDDPAANEMLEIDSIVTLETDVPANYTFTQLAKLIDPTCHNKQIEINKMAPLEFRTDNLICSNCGETFCADPDGINAPIDWTYCPNCGYRIVETNSGEDNNSER